MVGINYITYVLELVDGADLRFAIFICKGSSPFVGNKVYECFINYNNYSNYSNLTAHGPRF